MASIVSLPETTYGDLRDGFRYPSSMNSHRWISRGLTSRYDCDGPTADTYDRLAVQAVAHATAMGGSHAIRWNKKAEEYRGMAAQLRKENHENNLR